MSAFPLKSKLLNPEGPKKKTITKRIVPINQNVSFFLKFLIQITSFYTLCTTCLAMVSLRENPRGFSAVNRR